MNKFIYEDGEGEGGDAAAPAAGGTCSKCSKDPCECSTDGGDAAGGGDDKGGSEGGENSEGSEG